MLYLLLVWLIISKYKKAVIILIAYAKINSSILVDEYPLSCQTIQYVYLFK
jgi:hypothetical protein